MSEVGADNARGREARWRAWAWGAALAVITLVAYWPAMRGGGWIWDDDQYVTRNTTLRTWEGLARIWTEPSASPQYYPMTMTTFWVEWQLWGMDARGYHATNVLLHAGSAVLLWRLLARLGVPGAWLVAAVWAVHPVNVESVAWVTERKNVLSGVFYLGAVYTYLRFDALRIADCGSRSGKPWGWYGMALSLFCCALLSKTVTSTLPAAILLVIWWKRGVRWRDVWPLAPMFVVGLAMGAVTGWIERYHVGAQGAEFSHGWWERCVIAGRVVWFYFVKDVVPVGLSFICRRWEIELWQGVAAVGVLAALAGLFFMRNRIGRGPVTAGLFFVGTLVPALGFVNVYPMRFSFVADHFQYLASIGVIAGVVGGIVWGLGKRGCAIVGVLVPVLVVLSWGRARVMADAERLWRDTVAKNPGAWMAHTNLAVLLMDRSQAEMAAGRREAAERDLAEARREFEETRRLRRDLIEPVMNLGRVAELRGDLGKAERRMREAAGMKPAEAEPHFHLGRVLVEKGDAAGGMAEYRRAVELNPRYEPAMVNLGQVLADRGQWQEAIGWYRKAIDADPDSVFARTNLGNALLMTGNPQAAAEAYERVLKIEPGFGPAETGLAEAKRRAAAAASPGS